MIRKNAYFVQFSASRPLLPAYIFSATMVNIYSTYPFGTVACLKFLAIENMPPHFHFSAHVYYDQTAGWIRTPLDTEVCLGPGDIVLDGDPPPHGKGHSSPQLFGPLLWPASPHFSRNLFCRLNSALPRDCRDNPTRTRRKTS